MRYDERIMAWIAQYLQGQTVIRPYELAKLVGKEFGISRKVAQAYMMEHVRRVLGLGRRIRPV